MKELIKQTSLYLALVAGVASMPMQSAFAGTQEDLNAAVAKSQDLNTQLANLNLANNTLCGPMEIAATTAHQLADSLSKLNDNLAAPLHIDTTMLNSVDELIRQNRTIATAAAGLSVQLNTLSLTADAFTIKNGITTMLSLSDDIGTMADRIGEMSDKILVMSDNIGLMADRILLTQELQNQNVALTQQSILQTQTNALSLVSVVQDTSYSVSMSNLIYQGNLLSTQMKAVLINPLTLKTSMSDIATKVKTYQTTVATLLSQIKTDAAKKTSYINTSTLTDFNTLGVTLNSLSIALNGYVIATDAIDLITSKTSLYDAMLSMLRMSADIGLMSNQILEMADQILAMADNIGVAADQILVTQQLGNTNVASSQAYVLGAQTYAINTIKYTGL